MNYGDYAYIEAFPRGMFQFFPDPNIARRARSSRSGSGRSCRRTRTWRCASPSTSSTQLVENGLTPGRLRGDARLPDEERLRDDRDPGPAARLRARLAVVRHRRVHRVHARGARGADRRQVNAAIRKHLTARDLSVVIITKDAAGLKQALVSDAFSPIKYDGEKPAELLDEDKVDRRAEARTSARTR